MFSSIRISIDSVMPIVRCLIESTILKDIYEPETDPCLKVERYERTEEQNEELGLTDMSTESTDGMKPLRS